MAHAAESDVIVCPSRSVSPDFNPVDYNIWDILQERVYRLRIHDVKELKERQLLDHNIIMAAIAQWRSRLNACVRMNGEHFEHKF